ncbi:formimidoylglutamase [Riemerella columbina]|uniref:formimidoylglutamase n=1 Tax=Riemerella columbina TaxID=103810 RepID=UPI00266FC4E5|nr:formimidoylglutamase [Riemerella columbina]WKS94951.1 formimidoylglutamase [Riemerella columbina]
MNQIWKGRFDGDEPLYHRLFQRVILADHHTEIRPLDFALLGFAVDEGVRRNRGRVGAQEAPNIIRKNMGNFPVVQPQLRVLDFGNVSCEHQDLERAQSQLAEKVKHHLQSGAKSIVLGGGHEVTYAHYSGIRQAFSDQKIGIINIDAHFDNRTPSDGLASSGTGFWQIAQEQNWQSLHIGIQRNSNTLQLFDDAHTWQMKYILAEEIFFENLPKIYATIDELVASVDVLYLTICMDVFNVAIAPGVSAQAYNGIFADATFMHFYKHILGQQKLVALDVAEINPQYDLQERTARLAGSLLNEWLMIQPQNHALL